MQTRIILIGTGILMLLALIAVGTRQAGRLQFAGGPEGGTFLYFAQSLAAYIESAHPEYKFRVIGTGGSVENLKLVNSGKAVLALAHAGDIYLARQGELENENDRYVNIRALGRLFGSTAQLVVKQQSVIRTPQDLVNRRVAIGSMGSGAAHSAERFFRTIGIWEQITPLYIGYQLGMSELSSGRAEAVWQLVGSPSPSIQKLNRQSPLRLIPLAAYVRFTDFYRKYPFYNETKIPAGTYRGQQKPIDTFQDNSILITNKDADPELIRAILDKLYSPSGIARLSRLDPSSSELDIQKALLGIKIPLHPIAKGFWHERGML